MSRRTRTTETATESTPLGSYQNQGLYATVPEDEEDEDDDDYGGDVYFSSLKGDDSARRESIAADRLSKRLLAIPDDDSAAEDEILKETLDLGEIISATSSGLIGESFTDHSTRTQTSLSRHSMSLSSHQKKDAARWRLFGMIGVMILGLSLLVTAFFVGVQFIGPPNQPVGPYQLIERQVSSHIKSRRVMAQLPNQALTMAVLSFVGRTQLFSILQFLRRA